MTGHATAATAKSSCCCGSGAATAKAIDPVCGMTVDLATADHHHTHEGKEFFFCSAGCRTKFVAEPARYLQAKAKDSCCGSHQPG